MGVQRQYCGVLGRTANCQVAVSVSLVNRAMSVPAAWRLYLPESWAHDSSPRHGPKPPSRTPDRRRSQPFTAPESSAHPPHTHLDPVCITYALVGLTS